MNEDQKLPSIFSLIKDSSYFIWDNAWYLFKVLLMPAVIIVLMVIAGGMITAGGAVLVQSGRADSIGIVILALILITAFVVGGIILQIWGQTTLLVAIGSPSPSKSAKESYSRAWPMIKRTWRVMILSALIILGGFVPLMIPAVILSLSLMLAVWVATGEGQGGMEALLKSRYYTRGYRWNIFGKLIMLALIALIINTIIEALVDSSNQGVAIVGLIALIAFSFWQALIFLVVQFKIYTHLKVIKSSEPVPVEGKTKYIILAIWGGLGILLMLLAIPAAAILAAINPATQMAKARDAQAKNMVSEIISGVENYALKYNDYPNSLTDLKGEFINDIDISNYEYIKDDYDYKICTKLETEKNRYCRDSD